MRNSTYVANAKKKKIVRQVPAILVLEEIQIRSLKQKNKTKQSTLNKFRTPYKNGGGQKNESSNSEGFSKVNGGRIA